MSKSTGSFAGLGQLVDDHGFVGIDGHRVLDAGAGAEEAGAGHLQVDVVAAGDLGHVGLHGCLPGRYHFWCADIDVDGGDVAGLAVWGDCIKEKLLDRVRGLIDELLEAAVACEAGGIADDLAEAGVIGVLVFDGGGGEDGARLDRAYQSRELDSVAHAGLEVGVAVELDKVKVDAHDLRCLP